MSLSLPLAVLVLVIAACSSPYDHITRETMVTATPLTDERGPTNDRELRKAAIAACAALAAPKIEAIVRVLVDETIPLRFDKLNPDRYRVETLYSVTRAGEAETRQRIRCDLERFGPTRWGLLDYAVL